MEAERIPLIVGVTGHRAIRPEDVPALTIGVKKELERLQGRYPHSPLVMLNDLAEGADQLCAQAALSMGIPLIVALPMDLPEFERDFDGPALERFRSLYEQAAQCFVAPATEAVPETPDRDFFYRQQGIYVATHCHVLLALWDGSPGTEAACGTAEAVSFALERNFQPRENGPLLPTAAVIHLFTPREDRAEGEAGQVRTLGDGLLWRELMDRTEEFNALAGASSASPLLPGERKRDSVLDRLEAVYGRADRLSLRYARVYRRTLALLAVVSTLITAAFLLYDEANMHGLILAVGLAFLLAWILSLYAKKSSCHRRYLEYRVLAESLRVQACLRYGGVHREAVTLLPWSQQQETPWIAAAMAVLGVGPAPQQEHDILNCWPQDQLRYHLSAQKKAQRKLKGSGRVVGAALVISVGLYLAALVFELLFGGLLPRRHAVLNAEDYRTWLKLVLGSISAATLFISNYYGKLSLSRGMEDHEKMAAFYERIIDRLRRCGQNESLLLLLAREELIENGNWCSYQRDNTPDFSL